ncbi:hypothetical protein GOP47_0006833 [Adiantum capillus-veneris]|uniref:Uncharacterized protein n=1 Tax=Adiantum capillus-veneris TaxID=13818 RepID=A0A9D4ZMF5_ADICA|nr:hypothetical protein GOP47_0006833 [Adiantum capillus-veneris]
MVDPLSIAATIFASLQFVLQLKTYLHEKKKRKRQEQLEQHPHQHLYPAHLSSPITYCICYHIYQAYPYYNPHYMHPPPNSYLPPPLQQPPHLYYHNNHTYSRSLHNSVPRTPSNSSHSSTPAASYDWLGLLYGRMELLHYQEAPHNMREPLGMRTGACADNNKISSYQHWKSLQEESRYQGLQQKTIAVVDWSKGNIDMFMEIGGAYFRNYRVRGCDVEVFASLFKERVVFSGEIRGGKLEKLSKEMKMVENVSGASSTNSWMRLGIYEESELEMKEALVGEEGSFIETVRGAVFGLVCCLYEDPRHLNVDMQERAGHLDIVRVNSHHQHPHCHLRPKRHSCLFSVYSFGDHAGWAAQAILLG